MKAGQILNVFHRLLEFFVRGIFLLVAFISGPAESQPSIKDLTLLHSATTLALKIRNKQVRLFNFHILFRTLKYFYN